MANLVQVLTNLAVNDIPQYFKRVIQLLQRPPYLSPSTGFIRVDAHGVTVASGGIASGGIASGAIASGAIATGAIVDINSVNQPIPNALNRIAHQQVVRRLIT
jgi:hypothetical protein